MMRILNVNFLFPPFYLHGIVKTNTTLPHALFPVSRTNAQQVSDSSGGGYSG